MCCGDWRGHNTATSFEMGSNDISVAMCKCALMATASYIWGNRSAVTNVNIVKTKWKSCPKAKSGVEIHRVH